MPGWQGCEGLAKGESLKGKRVVIVEDVTTTGGSALKAVDAVRHAGGEVALVLTMVDRDVGAAETFSEAGLPFRSLSKASDCSTTDLGLLPLVAPSPSRPGRSPPTGVWRRRRQLFLVCDRAQRRGFGCRGAARFTARIDPAITPPIRQHAVVIDQIVTLPGGKDARMRLGRVNRARHDPRRKTDRR